MKFDNYLKNKCYKPYINYYINYSELVKKIYVKHNLRNIFIEKYIENVKNTLNFIKLKIDEFKIRLCKLELENDKDNKEKELKRFLDEFETFCEFSRINLTGYRKILKKYNCVNKEKIDDKYIKKIEMECERANEIIYEVSRVKLKNMTGIDKSNVCGLFIRKTRKYWVDKMDMLYLESKIVKNLPIYIFSKNHGNTPFSEWNYKKHDSCISSVYLDNIKFKLYYERMEKLQNAEAIRLRWYGSKKPSILFVERKRHEEYWTGETSKKVRFQIYEKDIVKYMNGEDVWDNVERINGKDVRQLYLEVQEKILKEKLRPMVRTVYKRNAYQIPNNVKIRISFDKNLTMVKECTSEEILKNTFPLKQWCRNDIGYGMPPLSLSKHEVVRFPHGILEIKKSGINSKEDNKWIDEIINSNLVEDVHKFSKFMHGCAFLYKNIKKVPYWVPQTRLKIKKDSFSNRKSIGLIVGNRAICVKLPKKLNITTPSKKLRYIENTQIRKKIILDNLHNKIIAVPNRVAPKIHFSNERIFLKWIKFGMYFGSIGITLYINGSKEKRIFAFFLSSMGLLFILYSAYLFFWRNRKIHNITSNFDYYDDLSGPTVIVGIYILSMLITVLPNY